MSAYARANVDDVRVYGRIVSQTSECTDLRVLDMVGPGGYAAGDGRVEAVPTTAVEELTPALCEPDSEAWYAGYVRCGDVVARVPNEEVEV